MRGFSAHTLLISVLCCAAWGAEHPMTVVGASASEGYFMRAKVTKIHFDGSIDFWITSVQELPTKKVAAADIDLPQLPEVIATLEFRRTDRTARGNSDLLGSVISLRGKCEDIDRATRASVIQIRQKASQRWRQVKLKTTNRKGYAGFKEIAARVCAFEDAS